MNRFAGTWMIAGKDIREFARDGRLLWAGGLMLVLLLTAIALGWQQQVTVQQERVAGEALDYDAWLKQGQRHPHNAADQGMHVFRPQPPLSIMDPGIDPYVGSSIWLRGHRQSETKFRPAQDATGIQRFGNLSPAWLMQVLAPLLIIVLGFSAFATEREQGTLRQLLSLGITGRQLLWGKALALATTAGALLLPGVVIAVALVLSAPGAGLGAGLADVLARAVLMGLAYALYLGMMIFLVLGVSALCRRARTALFILLAVWICGVLIAPRTIADLAAKTYPSPSRLTFEAELSGDLDSASQKVWTQAFNVAEAWSPDLPLNQWGKALQLDDRSGYGVLDQHFGALWNTFERQQKWQEAAGIVAPVVSLRAFSMAMAGTDFSHYRHFSEAAERQRRVIQEVVSDDLVRHADPLGDRHFSYKAGPELWTKVPRFHYDTPPVSLALLEHWAGLLVLLLAFAASLIFARMAASRRLAV